VGTPLRVGRLQALPAEAIEVPFLAKPSVGGGVDLPLGS
jgi:hypothetical protein